jgi:hypothetical protein
MDGNAALSHCQNYEKPPATTNKHEPLPANGGHGFHHTPEGYTLAISRRRGQQMVVLGIAFGSRLEIWYVGSRSRNG